MIISLDAEKLGQNPSTLHNKDSEENRDTKNIHKHHKSNMQQVKSQHQIK